MIKRIRKNEIWLIQYGIKKLTKILVKIFKTPEENKRFIECTYSKDCAIPGGFVLVEKCCFVKKIG